MKVLENQQHQQYPDVLNGALLAIRISKHKSTGFICRPYYVQSTRNVRQELMQEFPYIYAPVQTTAVAFGKKKAEQRQRNGRGRIRGSHCSNSTSECTGIKQLDNGLAT